MTEFDVATFMRQQGYRVTSQRLLVLSILQASDQPLSVEEVHDAVRELQPTIDLTTIYRVLQFLQDVRLAAPLTINQGPQRYKYRAPGDDHHHLVCKQCGTNIQIPDSAFTTLRNELSASYRFMIHLDHLVINGLCETCQSTPVPKG